MFIGWAKGERFGCDGKVQVHVEIELKDTEHGPALSIVGDITRGRGWFECGQIQDTIRDMLKKGEFIKLKVPREDLEKLLDIWDRWHLNNARPYCPHQAAKAWELYRQGITDYDDIIKVPEMAKCPVCGYRYGSKWWYEPIPPDILAWLKDFIAAHS